MAKLTATIRLIVFPAFIIWSCVYERKTINGYDAGSVEAVIKTHVFDIRELLQSEDNGVKCDQE